MTQLDDIHNEVKAVGGKMDDMLTWKGTVDQRCKAERSSMENVKVTLFGNPNSQNGLVSRVQCLMENKKMQLTTKQFWQGILQKVITWAIIAVIVTALYMWKTGTPGG